MLNLTDRDRCFVIAEAGTAHVGGGGGDIEKAIALVRAAAKAGADAVKFQWFTRDVSQETMFCWIDGDETRAWRWRGSYLPASDWRAVKDQANACGIVLLASCFEYETVSWLSELGIPATKVASRAAKNFPYGNPSLPRPFLVSTGMGFKDVPLGSIFFDCESQYPSTRAWHPECGEGFSDHSGTVLLPIDAIFRGCKVLEVHFMLNQKDAGPDLPACLTVDELKLICQARDYYAERKAAA